jgi:hypothetical protein
VIGIYKVKDDEMQLCFRRGVGGGERPKEFESPEGSDVALMVLTRVKHKQDEKK